ncbi:hypothetical protein SNE25_15310 [Mucilaginibacter sabulilitoris]|uniref:Uncharacterized protein n=1 Tax=Mucilaginibacter sabulilitoris TaxID=1173583 RepID=A0ABZ0TXT8_9SPHI|nr:hypothetical protein [Mucilaginibacter sabulilitoris]WPU96888.1 hypothetical protein SNE25_15310 [Mucilaginibacter sabulilitoris]
MKGFYLTLFVSLLTGYRTYAQNTFPSSGNVGIGTTTPQGKLNVIGQEAIRITGTGASGVASLGYLTFFDSNNTVRRGYLGDASSGDANIYLTAEAGGGLTFGTNGIDHRMFINTLGNVGIGTLTPVTLLSVAVSSPKTTVAGNVASFLSTNEASGPFGLRTMIYGAASIADRYVTLQTTDYALTDGGSLVLQPSVGNVGVGTADTKGYKFAVNGSAIATSMTVKLYANWPDYVFKKDYQLPSLSEVKTYIDQNQHLPDMPSERELAKDGLNLGEMNKLLVKKVEELTLYLIEKENKDKQQQEQIDQLIKQVKSLRKK